MHSLFLLILLGFFVAGIHSRPSQSDDNIESQEQEEVEYEGDNGSLAEDTVEDSRFGDEGSNVQDLDQSRRLLDMNRNKYLHKTVEEQGPKTNIQIDNPTRTRDVRDDKSNEAVNTNEEFQTFGKRRQFSRYIENSDANDQSEMAQHLTNHDINNVKSNRMHNNMILDSSFNKRTIESKKAHPEEGDLLFGNNRDPTSKADKNDYIINEPLELNQRSLYPKQYNNQMQSDRAMLDINNRNNEYLYYNRARRETKKSNQEDPENISNIETSNEGLEKSDNENEEMAIKRHIKKMSGDELEQLLNTLSEEKRALLKKIIDDVDNSEKTYDSINKREITKKSGAVEYNNYIESQSESSKVEGGFSSIELSTAFPSSKNIEGTEATKQTENQADSTALNSQKSSQETNPEDKADLKSDNDNSPEKSDNSFAPNTDSNKNQVEVAANEQVTSKNENKRETNLENMADASFEDPKLLENEYTKESRGEEGYICPQDEDLSQFLDEVEQSRSYDNSKLYKRDVETQSEIDSKLKSLEESFPNADAYDESGPYSGPLIRVKRKNNEKVMKKRSAAVLPDAKVGFFAYKAESNDDDTEEGNEFDDDGFYDPTPNFVSNENKNVDISNSQQTGTDDASCKLNNIDHSKSPISDASAGTINLGSDTDNVLSSVEGVDENLMFNSGTRNRRKSEGKVVENVDENDLIQSAHGKTSDSEIKTNSNSDINIPNYQDSDSFGGFPRNYEGDLGRYKRIRRVKHSHISEEPSNT